jgi:hypothetical protein
MGTDDDRAEWTSLILLERFRDRDDLAAAEIFDLGETPCAAEVASAAPVVSPRSLRRGVPEWLDALCRKCLAKEPAARFPNVHHLRSALAAMNLAGS